MSDLSDLYYGPLAGATREARGHNPLCGDRLTVFLKLSGDAIEDIRFEGSGCAISKASASLMTEAVKGRTVAEALGIFQRFQAMITAPLDQAAGDESLGKLTVLAGVREFPVRIKCASLSWHTLKAAMAASSEIAVTE
jgi:nitrogen fixation protein NifU and related proteins